MLLNKDIDGLVFLLDGSNEYNWGILFYNKVAIGRYSIYSLTELSKQVLKYKEEIKTVEQSFRFGRTHNGNFGGYPLEEAELKTFENNQLQRSFEDLLNNGADKEKAFHYCQLILLIETNTAEAFPDKASFLKNIDLNTIKNLIHLKSNKKINEYLLELSDIIHSNKNKDLNEFYYQLSLGVSKEIFYRGLNIKN